MGCSRCSVLGPSNALCLALLVNIVTATYGPPVVHCRDDFHAANFSWTIPAAALGKEILVVNPRGEKMFSKIGNVWPRPEDTFYENVTNFEMDDTTIKFSWPRVSPTDAGFFYCKEGSITGPEVPECGQTLHYIDVDRPHVRQSGLPVQGKHFSLSCEVYIPSEAQQLGLKFVITWIRNGKPVHGQHERLLLFKPLNVSDEGAYTCRVIEETQGCGSSNESFPYSLHVIAPPILSLRRHIHRPHLEFLEGAVTTLTCDVIRAYPPVDPDNFTWTFSPSDSSSAWQLPQRGDTLTFDPATRNHSGQYTCQAWNADLLQGSVSLPPGNNSVHVMVSYMENLKLTPDVEVKEGENFTLTCSVESSPTALLQWLVDGRLLQNVTANVDHYVVVKATRRDSGKYTCSATNPFKQNKMTSNVTVLSSNTSSYQDDVLKMGDGDKIKNVPVASSGRSSFQRDTLLGIGIVLTCCHWLLELFGG